MANRCASTTLLLAAFIGTSAVQGADNGDPGAEDRKIAQLERQLAVLRESYTLARTDADSARKQVREIRERLEALGATGLGESEERLIETVAQLEAARIELETLKKGALKLSEAINTYTKSVLVEDAQAAQNLEAVLRELDVALGYRQAQQDEFDGTLNESTVLSIDTESGLIVINAGREAKVEVGMPMEIARGDQAIAIAMVTDVRKKVAGLLVQKHLNPALTINVGDRVSVKTSD